ncbi:hypothetical protein ZOSMA_177G00040 [Zostera marina]|uniref:Uncharacterized protein n=1 Tax=Zostera marina TaxID=29655 RepID=A0A0K9PRT0_ZOSMR|nr:hypothetical protein ZOSMA_177G00040 [Zostera marina]
MENSKDFFLQRPTCNINNDMYLDIDNSHPNGYNAVFDCRNYAFFTKDTVMLPFKCLESEEYDYEDHKSRLSPDPPIIITDLESNIRDRPLRSSSIIIRLFKHLFNLFLPSRARNSVRSRFVTE